MRTDLNSNDGEEEITRAILILAFRAVTLLTETFKFVHDEDEACANSGATDVMLNDYQAFILYKPAYGRYVTLGDETRLPLLRTGTAKFSLNGKLFLFAMPSPSPIYAIHFTLFKARSPSKYILMGIGL